MEMLSKAVFRTEAINRNGSRFRFGIASGRGTDPGVIANLYNSVLGQLEQRMAVTPDDIAARLKKDRRSVYLGFLRSGVTPLKTATFKDCSPIRGRLVYELS